MTLDDGGETQTGWVDGVDALATAGTTIVKGAHLRSLAHASR